MDSGNTVWVTGSKGFLGSVVCHSFEQAGFTVVGTDEELSVCEPERLEAFVEEVRPAVVVNCAGIRRDATTMGTRAKAYEVNALGARNVAVAANVIGATVVQISSDDVYSSKLDEPVNEFDGPHPNSAYGKSKRAGEMMVRDITSDHLIVRSSWLYHAYSGRFKGVMDAAQAGGRYEAIKREKKGTFHLVSHGRASRYEFAAKVLEYAGYDPEKVLVPTSDAKTAENVVLESMMLEMAGVQVPTWEEDLAAYMKSVGLYAPKA